MDTLKKYEDTIFDVTLNIPSGFYVEEYSSEDRTELEIEEVTKVGILFSYRRFGSRTRISRFVTWNNIAYFGGGVDSEYSYIGVLTPGTQKVEASGTLIPKEYDNFISVDEGEVIIHYRQDYTVFEAVKKPLKEIDNRDRSKKNRSTRKN